MSEKVAVIGMGQMGSGMAGRLRESNLDVVGYDVSAEQRDRLTKDGFRMTSSIAEALAGRTMVLTSLPDPKAVTEAWLGADGHRRARRQRHAVHRALDHRPADDAAGRPRPPPRAASRWSIARSAAARTKRAPAS